VNRIHWAQVAVFGLVALLVFLVGGGCLILLLAGTTGGGMMGGSGGTGWCPWCGQPIGGGPGRGGMMGGYGSSGFMGSIFSLLMMGAVIGVPLLLILLVIGVLVWLARGAGRPPTPGGKEE
jgi:hypothetical protein